MTGRPQPIELARLKGAHRKDPARYNKDIPKSDAPLGDPPEHLGDAAVKVWRELCDICLPGVLTDADRIAVEALAELLAEFRSNPVDFQTSRLNAMIKILSSLGMTPVDRTRLGVAKKKKDENPFANL